MMSIGKKFALTAKDEITRTAGAAQIIMKTDGTIQIKRTDSKIDGSGKIVGKSASEVVANGSSTITLS